MRRSCSFTSQPEGGSLPSFRTPGHPGLGQGRVLLLLALRLLPLPANTRRGRSFEGSLTSPQPEVGDILGLLAFTEFLQSGELDSGGS